EAGDRCAGGAVRRPGRRGGAVPARRGRDRRRVLARRAPDRAADAGLTGPHAHPRGRVVVRARGARRPAGRRQADRGAAGRPRAQAPRGAARVLERHRRARPLPRDHLARRLRAVLRRGGTALCAGRARHGGLRRPEPALRARHGLRFGSPPRRPARAGAPAGGRAGERL
ncbi:MAG: hypothetical protein AVDCRST_MAG53-1441, partial [uncultured Solirubrobacteraceae bacterium]